jgi:hypothetical protein
MQQRHHKLSPQRLLESQKVALKEERAQLIMQSLGNFALV